MKKVLLMSLFALAFAAASCGGGTNNKCDDVSGACTEAGSIQCRADKKAVIECKANADGCLVWTPVTTCGARQECTGTPPKCECSHECLEGQTRCNGTVVESCAADSSGCRFWQAGEDCVSSNKVCTVVEGTAQCSEACVSDCTTLGATHCKENVVEKCEQDGTCLKWKQIDVCDAAHQFCQESGGAAACTCETGYAGDDCSLCAAGYHKEGDVCVEDEKCMITSCSGHGICDDSSGVVVCTCDTGYAGAHCESCAEGYQDNDGDHTCLPNCTTAGLNCNNHGTCSDDSGTALCVCDTGYAGAYCENCADGYQDNDGDKTCQLDCAHASLSCWANSHCSDTSGTAVCVCDDGYQDNDHNDTCLPACQASTCSGHGSCDDSTGTAVCTCDTGYTGTACNQCDQGYQDNDHNGTCLPDCTVAQLDCGQYGHCDDGSGTAVCVCDHQCSQGQESCVNNVPAYCASDTHGCRYWELGSACQSDEYCEVVGGTASCIAADCSDKLVDGDFEGGSPSTAWTEASNNFGTPLCDPASCNGFDLAYSGSWYVWFGGCDTSCNFPEVGSLSQQVTLPANQTITLFFFLFAYPGNNGTANDIFSVQIDNNTVFDTNVLDTTYQSGYTLVSVDLTPYGDGAQHTITFYSSVVSAGTTFLMDLASLRIGDNCCVDTCSQDGLSVCSGNEIYTCQTNTNGCLEWTLTADCSANGQVCIYDNNQPYCQTPSPATVGTDCNAADAATPLTLPAEFMAPVVGQTNCGLGNTYSNTCLGNYDGGEDAILRVVVTEPVIARFVLDPKDSDWTGMALDSVCPLDSGANDCILKATNYDASPYSTACAQLAAGTYYMMFDTWPTPNCITQFDLIAVPCDCVTGQTRCADANTLQTCNESGVWTDRVCLAGCSDASGTAQCLPTGDTCAQAVALDVSLGSATVQVDNISNTDSFSAYSCVSGSRTGADIWLSFTLTEAAQVTITTSAPGTITDTVLALFDACGGTELACNDDFGSSYYSRIQATLQPGTYYIVSEPYSTTARGTWTVTVTVTP